MRPLEYNGYVIFRQKGHDGPKGFDIAIKKKEDNLLAGRFPSIRAAKQYIDSIVAGTTMYTKG